MKTSKHERAALSGANAQSAIEQAYALLGTDKEAVQAAHWNRLPEATRKMICHMAGIGADKGKGALRNLDALERGRVHLMAVRLIRELEILTRCAQGGDMPKAPGIGHELSGIAAIGRMQ